MYKSDKILNHAAEIDLDYTLEDLPKIIDAMTVTCTRLKNISTSYRIRLNTNYICGRKAEGRREKIRLEGRNFSITNYPDFRSLRIFSHADREDKVPFNIHQGIDSTLLILKHRFKNNQHRPEIEVITNYGNLPNN